MARAALCLCLCLLCTGFEWPGRLHRLRYELSHGDAETRRDAVRLLGRYSAERVSEALLARLEDDDPGVRREAALSAGRVGLRGAVPILIDWLDDRDEQTRLTAARALGTLGDERAVAPLTRVLGDASATVRRAAARALTRIGQTESVVPLIGRLDDTDLGVRLEAIEGLSELGDARAVVPLLGQARDPSPDLRRAVAMGLGHLGDGRALPALHRALDDELEEVRVAAAAAVGELAQPASADALAARLGQADARLARALIAALGRIDVPAAQRALIEQLGKAERSDAAARALLERQRRALARAPQGEAAPDDLVQALVDVLTREDADGAQAAADTLTRLSALQPIGSAAPALLQALSRAPAERAGPIATALAATAAPESLMPLLEWVGRSRGKALGQALDALSIYFERAEPDGRAADPLLEALGRADAEHRPAIARLLGRIGAPRALDALLPLLDSDRGAVRIATAAALADIADPRGVEALAGLLEDADGRLRFEAAHALGRSADARVVARLLQQLATGQAVDRHAVLVALAGALPRVAAEPGELRKAALATLQALLEDDDDALGERALDTLAAWHPPEALETVAQQLRTPSADRRRAAAAALGAFPAEQARPILRYALQHGSTPVATAAAASLGEAGDRRDVKALVKATHRRHWPLPGAVAYALLRLGERGAVKPRAMSRTLCELGASREPFVRANVAAALARLSAGPCPEGGPDPIAWLSPEHAPAVREAAAHWLHAALAAERVDVERARRALERCRSADLETSVREACEEPRPPGERSSLGVYAHESDAVTPMRERLVALRLPGAGIFLGYTDANGHVRVHAAPDGPVRLEDPGQVPLEPR